MRYFFRKMLRWCLVCVICISSSFHSFIFTLCVLWLITHWTCAPNNLFIFDNILGIVEFRQYYIYTTFGVLTFCNLSVICNSNRFHSFIIKLCIIIVHHWRCAPATQVQSRIWSCLNWEMICSFGLMLNIPVNSYGHVGMVSLPRLTALFSLANLTR